MNLISFRIWMTVLVIASCILTSSSVIFAESKGTVQEPSTKKSFPSEVSFDAEGVHYDLDLTGVALRKKFIVNVYAVAHYMQGPLTGSADQMIEAILADGKAKQLTFDFAHKATGKQIQDAFSESFHKDLTSEQYNAISQEINTYISYFKDDMQVNDQYILRWLPKGTVIVIIKGEKKEAISNPAFAKALWSIWFGPNSAVGKDKLISIALKEPRAKS